MGARREVLLVVAEHYRSAGRIEKGRMLDALCRTTGWHRKHAVRALRRRVVDKAVEIEAPRERKRRYGATIRDALTALCLILTAELIENGDDQSGRALGAAASEPATSDCGRTSGDTGGDTP